MERTILKAILAGIGAQRKSFMVLAWVVRKVIASANNLLDKTARQGRALICIAYVAQLLSI